VALLSVVSALLLAACAADPEPPAAGSTPTPVAVAPPGCAAGEAGDFWLPPGATSDAGAVFTLGTGNRGVVLAPESGGDICQWLPQGRRLAAAGYRVAMFNWDIPYESPLTNAARRLRDLGATKVVLVGASQGGAYVLGLAASLEPAGVISLSGEASFGDLDNLSRIRAYAGPLLLVGSEDDGYTPGDATRNLARNHPGSEQIIILPGTAHGLALLSDSEVLTAVDGFLARHTR
jgi:pimeloyl-ACP methyl ester carboxylesterase